MLLGSILVFTHNIHPEFFCQSPQDGSIASKSTKRFRTQFMMYLIQKNCIRCGYLEYRLRKVILCFRNICFFFVTCIGPPISSFSHFRNHYLIRNRSVVSQQYRISFSHDSKFFVHFPFIDNFACV